MAVKLAILVFSFMKGIAQIPEDCLSLTMLHTVFELPPVFPLVLPL